MGACTRAGPFNVVQQVFFSIFQEVIAFLAIFFVRILHWKSIGDLRTVKYERSFWIQPHLEEHALHWKVSESPKVGCRTEVVVLQIYTMLFYK